MSSMPHREYLFRRISAHLAHLPKNDEPKLEGVDRIIVEIAGRLVAEHPELGSQANRGALMMAVEMKFSELKEEILHCEHFEKGLDAYRADFRAHEKLIKFGVVSAP